jgi:DNA processing protein
MTTTVTSRLRRMPPWDDRERGVLLALMGEHPRAAWSALVAEIIEAGSAWAVWTAQHGQTLFDSDPPGPVAEAGRRLAEWRTAGLGVHTFRDLSFPAQLREIHQVPPVLFSRGDLRVDERAVFIVGSRRASDRALAWTHELAGRLVSAGVGVVSGLATGIDTAAHNATLEARGRTVAVLGTGIHRAYPAANQDLQDRIGREGLVLSQFWPDDPPTKQSFPMRNATMSGYGRATSSGTTSHQVIYVIVEPGASIFWAPKPDAPGRVWPRWVSASATSTWYVRWSASSV